MTERTFIHHGETLTSGHNVDPVDITAGLAMGASIGYDDPESQMVLEYALWRWGRGEETGAERIALNNGVDLTSWRMTLAAAVAAAHDPT